MMLLAVYMVAGIGVADGIVGDGWCNQCCSHVGGWSDGCKGG